MSLQAIKTLSPNILGGVFYVPSPSLEYYIKGLLKEKFKAHRDFIVSVDTGKGLHNAKLDSFVAPLFSEKWLIHANADKLTKKELSDGLKRNTAFGLTFYWTSNYVTYLKLTGMAEYKSLGNHAPNFSFSRLEDQDIMQLHKDMLTDRQYLDSKLLAYVQANYKYDPQAVCDLFAMVKSGSEIETKKDIIESIGLGGNSVSNLAVRILTTKPKTEKSKKTSVRNVIKVMEDLSITYNYGTIRKFLITTIEGFIEMKQLQIMGVYKRVGKEIPETFNTKRLSKLKRFEYLILHKITMVELINLKLCLSNYTDFDAEISLIQAITEYINALPTEE